MKENLDSQVKTATKWSALTEISAKLVTPITSMVLARLLTPESYGIIATLNMIIVFAEIFTDAGFQKYIVQHEFKNDQDKDECVNVAFWSNFFLSMLLWLVIACLATPLMNMVGNPGYEYPLIIACVSIPLAAFSSIQMALYRRNLEYKTLFKIRIIGILVPLIITIPCAYYFRNYWALLTGAISTNLINAFVLSYFSKWKPRLYYSCKQFKDMFSFTVWSMLEAISNWLVSYFDVFVIGSILSQHYLGLYKTTSGMVTQVFAVVTATTSSILFASLSRTQNNRSEFERLFFRFQKVVAILVIPLGMGFYCYSNLFITITMGNQWYEASDLVGLWGITSSFMIILNHYCGTAYRALGKPKLATLSEWFHIIVLWPSVYFAAKYSFDCLCYTRSLIRFQHIIVDFIIMALVLHFPVGKMINNIIPSIVASLFFGIGVIIFNFNNGSVAFQLCTIIVCVIVYFCIISIFPHERKIVIHTISNILNKVIIKHFDKI